MIKHTREVIFKLEGPHIQLKSLNETKQKRDDGTEIVFIRIG